MNRITLILITSLLAPGLTYAQSNSVNPSTEKHETAIFAGGCFWCLESDLDKVPGVVRTLSGYSNGHKNNPSYRQVSAGGTGHAEVVQVVYDATRVSYKQLLDVFWRNIDPTVEDRQFCDRGDQYRSGIFYLNEQQRKLAVESKTALEKSKPFKAGIVTEITRAGTFYPAEDYHQDYYKKNPLRYKYYRFSCGRDKRLEELWGKKK